MSILIVISVCFWSDKFCYLKSEPMTTIACEQQAKFYNYNRVLKTQYAYCEEQK